MTSKPDKLFDLQELRTIAAGDKVFFSEMVRLFISQNEAALLDIRTQVAKKEFSLIKGILHKMKPSIMVMGVTTATEIIKQVEQLELSAMKEPGFTELLKQLETILKEVNDQLRKM